MIHVPDLCIDFPDGSIFHVHCCVLVVDNDIQPIGPPVIVGVICADEDCLLADFTPAELSKALKADYRLILDELYLIYPPWGVWPERWVYARAPFSDATVPVDPSHLFDRLDSVHPVLWTPSWIEYPG